ENFRKRVEKELHEARTSASADLVKSLLPVIDNLERGLESSQGSDGPLRQGLVLIHQQLVEFLKKAGLRPMETLGSSFDPRLHEAVQVMDVDGFEEGVILEEMQKGYTFNDRMLRPAMVKVASGRKPKGAAQAPGAGS
ncbi:MAG TPA: nucleotide exchange factor GrpE, partial [Candidatus Polarisedimenticolia bacterium]|nr:nucleotide exchange factor GrpE [Candidatus Polarisedimenticolia bacterium]